ncbi:MAG: GntR family transcriptional regulator [Burkholderiales bacterium]|nr:GntR family transcriptional regulator [Burkholderiales bacterium]
MQTPVQPNPAPVVTALSGMATVGTTPAFSPLYQQIKNLILRSLEEGEWKPGDVIPSEQELATRFKVSQGTVRKAIDELASENLVVRRQGKGTYVATHAERHIQYRFLRLQPDVGEERPAQRTIIECKRQRASAEIARLLGIRSADPVILVRRVLSMEGAPTILEDIWLPGTQFKGLTHEALSSDRGPMYAFFEREYGVRMVRADEKIKAVAATTEMAELLSAPVGHPLLSVERIAYTYNDVPMELRRGLYRTDTHHYKNELS